MATDLARFGRDSIDRGSQSFALASRVLDPAMRDDATLLYAYCRYADDLVDGQVMGHGQLEDYKAGQGARVTRLRQETRHVLSGGATNEPHYAGLAQVVRRYALPTEYVFQHIDGFQMDADERVYHTVEDVLDYSYHVAGVVGVMMAWLMGVRDAATLDRASDLGVAFQLTNIARDVVDDAKADRVFVPRDVLRKHGAPLLALELADRDAWPAAHRAALELVEMAEPYYASARVGACELGARNRWAILTALGLYREIGAKLRAVGPSGWGGRVSTTKGRKIALAVKALGSVARRPAEASRAGLYLRPSAPSMLSDAL